MEAFCQDNLTQQIDLQTNSNEAAVLPVCLYAFIYLSPAKALAMCEVEIPRNKPSWGSVCSHPGQQPRASSFTKAWPATFIR